MLKHFCLSALFLLALHLCYSADEKKGPGANIPNPAIDYAGFLKAAQDLQSVRESHLITEQDFLKMAAEPATVTLDPRSPEQFARLHVKGAVNLSFPDFTALELARIIPDKSTRILIYPGDLLSGRQLQKKTPDVAAAALSIFTFNTLHGYGYTNVYELKEASHVGASLLVLEGTDVSQK